MGRGMADGGSDEPDGEMDDHGAAMGRGVGGWGSTTDGRSAWEERNTRLGGGARNQRWLEAAAAVIT